MAVTTPEWLTRHGGSLRPDYDGHSWLVMFEGGPQYLLTPIPASGKYYCQVLQTINGKHLESSGTYPSADEALAGGLEDLRKSLGW